MMKLTERDQKILFFLPAVLVLLAYVVFGFLPLDAARQKAAKQRVALGENEDALRARIEQAATYLAQTQDAFRATEHWAAHESPLPFPPAMPVSERLQQLFAHMRDISLKLVSATEGRAEDGRSVFARTRYQDAHTYWILRFQGNYPAVREFLDRLAQQSSSIAETIRMIPSPEPGKPAEWVLTLRM